MSRGIDIYLYIYIYTYTYRCMYIYIYIHISCANVMRVDPQTVKELHDDNDNHDNQETTRKPLADHQETCYHKDP